MSVPVSVFLLLIAVCSALGNQLPKKIPALGRPFALGDLYDLKNDIIIKGPKLWTDEHLQDFREMESHQTEFEIISSENINEKNSHFDIKASISLSFMAGLVKVSGSAAYLDDRIQKTNVARVSLQYQSKTFLRELKPYMYTDLDFKNVLKKIPSATHVVGSIQYGAGAVFVFDRTVTENEVKKNVEGSMSIAVKSLPGIEISGSGEVKLTDEQKKNSQQFRCKFYGDFVLENHPASYEDAIKVYKDLPKLLGPNFEHSVPMTVWLYPLESLPVDTAAQHLHEISNSIINQVTFEMEDLNKIITLSNDILDSEVAVFHNRINQKVMSFKSMVEQFLLLFKQNLAKLLPEIRGKGTAESSLSKMLADKEGSPFSKLSLRAWVNDLLEETAVLKTTQSMPNYCKNDGSFAAMLQNNVKYTFGLTMRLDTIEDDYLDAMENLLAKKRIEATEGYSAYLGRKDKWWRPGEQMASDLHIKGRSFFNFYLEEKEKKDMNLKSEIQFLVRETELDPSKDKADRGIKIELFQDAKLIDADYEIPSNPGVPEEVESTHESIQIKWAEPLEGKKNIKYYEITIKMLNESSTDTEDLYIDIGNRQTSDNFDFTYTAKGLESKRTYLFIVSVYSILGKTAESIESKFIQTKSCPKGMFHTSEHKCDSCNPGLYSDTIGAKSCTKCPLGTYKESFGGSSLTDCAACPKGTYNEKMGAISFNQCSKCPRGTFNEKTRSSSQSECSRCPPGTFNNVLGQTSKKACIPCNAGSYNPNEGALRCILCLNGSTTTKPGAVNDDQCGTGSIDSKLQSVIRESNEKMRSEREKLLAEIQKEMAGLTKQTDATNKEVSSIKEDHCASNPCANGGTCINSVGNFVCICKGEFAGSACRLPPVLIAMRPFKSSSYGISRTEKTWEDARSACILLGGDLAGLQTDEEWLHFYSEVARLDDNEAHWLSGNNNNEGSEWRWGGVQKIGADRKGWRESRQAEGNCLSMSNTLKWSESNNWYKDYCDSYLKFICEFD